MNYRYIVRYIKVLSRDVKEVKFYYKYKKNYSLVCNFIDFFFFYLLADLVREFELVIVVFGIVYRLD